MKNKANIRSRIDSRFELFGHFVYRNRIKTLLLMLVLITVFFSQLPKITFDTSNESYFHKGDPTISDYDAFRDQFGREEIVIIAVNPPEVFDRVFLERLRDFHRALEDKVPFIEEVTSLITVRNTRGEGDELIVEDLLKTIPETPEEMARLKERVLSSPLYPNFLISEDGRFTTVVIEPYAYSPENADGELLAGFKEQGDPPRDGADQEREVLTVEENIALVNGIEEVVAEFEAPEFPLYAASGPVMDVFFNKSMERDMGLFLALAVLVIAVFLLVLFRRFSGVVLPLLVVLLSLTSTIGLMAATGISFTIPTTILPSFLLAVSVGASVHLLAIFFRDFREHGDKERAIVYALGHSGLPIMMTALTTAAGLWAFGTSEMAPVAHLGIFGGSGVLIALVYTLVLIPAILALWPMRQQPRFGVKRRTDGFDRLLIGIADFATSNARSIVIVSLALMALAGVGLFSLRFSMNFVEWLPKSLEIRKSIDLIEKEMKGSVSLEVVIDTGRENGLYEPVVMKGIQSLARFAEQYRNENGKILVGKTSSVANVLKETNKALHENRQEFYSIPETRELISQELLLFENSGSDDLEQMVDNGFSKARLSIMVPFDNAAVYVSFVSSLRKEAGRVFGDLAEIQVTGTMNLFMQMMYAMMRSMARSYLIAGFVITLMMMILIGSIRLGLLSMVINVSSILVTMGLIMGFAGIPLDAMTLLIGSIALGLAVDDTIHFFHNFRKYFGKTRDVREATRQTLLTSGRAMLFTTLVLVTGFWMFMLATLNNVFNFGMLTGLTLIFALLADFLFAPALLVLVTRTAYGRQLTERWSGT